MENNIDISSVKFLFATPQFENVYAYGINTIEDLQFIDKDELKNLLFEELHCSNMIRVVYLMDRNFPFYYDCVNHELKEFKAFGEDLTQEDIFEKLFNDESNYEETSMFNLKFDDDNSFSDFSKQFNTIQNNYNLFRR